MLKFILSIIFISGMFFFPSPSPINYQPKSFTKQIERLWGLKNTQKKEIILERSVKEKHKIGGKFFTIIDNSKLSPKRYAYIGRVNSCRAGGCSISDAPSVNIESEYFDYFILFNSNLEVELVKVFNYQATHGQEVTVKGWLKQFIGYKGDKSLQVGKQIDAIAGATISAYAITLDIEYKTKLLKSLKTSFQ